MLKLLTQRLICPFCRKPEPHLKHHVFREGEDEHISEGVILCSDCGTWYPIERDVLEFVPPALLYQADLREFEARYSTDLTAIGCKPQTGQQDEGAFPEQVLQRGHFDRYAAEVEPGFKDYTQTPFIRAAGARFVKLWRERLDKPEGWVLDIGCGTGISSFPLLDQYGVIGFDISKQTIRRVTEKARAMGVMKSTTFYVGDGSFLPFREACFDYSQTFGALHHLPDPADTVRQLARILKPGGRHFAVENNASAFRGLFDLMMRIKPLWIEEAGAEPLISHATVRRWAREAGVDAEIETSVFLPPHLFNLLADATARSLLDASDRIGSKVPWFGRQGGQIVFSFTKPAYSGRLNRIETCSTTKSRCTG
jgi:SAM-dependent methyltransferase/uncharacterized protein YbaR (Trm112 family)